MWISHYSNTKKSINSVLKEVTDSYLSTLQENMNFFYVAKVKSYVINSFKFYYNRVIYYKNKAQKTHKVSSKYYFRVKTLWYLSTYMLDLQSLLNQLVYNIYNK